MKGPQSNPVTCTPVPLQGIKFLQQAGKVGESPEDVARYLFKGELLNKRAIGDYLGEG